MTRKVCRARRGGIHIAKNKADEMKMSGCVVDESKGRSAVLIHLLG